MNMTYARLVDGMPYAAWAAEFASRFLDPAWLADASLKNMPASVKAVFEGKAGDGRELKVYIGPSNPEFAAFYAAGAVELPLTHPGTLVVMDVTAFIDCLGTSVYKHAVVTPLPANGPVPSTYKVVTRGAPVPEFTVTKLSSGFVDAVSRGEWHVSTSGAFATMSFFLQLMHRRTELVGPRIEACVALERSIAAARMLKAEAFRGPTPLLTSIHCGTDLGFLCARFSGCQKLVLLLSEAEFDAMTQTFPILKAALSATSHKRQASRSYTIPFQTLRWTKGDDWVGRVQLEAFVCSQETSPQTSTFLLLQAAYIDF